MGDESTRNRLLVSVPATGDLNFEQSVVYVIDHDADGAIGVILNRPGELESPEQLDLGVPEASPAVVFDGGPVSPDSMILLGRRRIEEEGRGIAVVGGAVAVVTAAAVEEGEVSGIDVVRVYRGYAGWAPRQLDSELAAGTWVVLDALPDDVFCSEPHRLWRSVLSREGGRLASMARFPDEPGLN
jgi:putative transcriptional regulator